MVKEKITNPNIKKLNKNQIFVFGSNLVGKHGKGAAKLALNFGAIYGQGVGLQGNTYAIPTKDRFIKTLPIPEIEKYIIEFIEFAKTSEYIFLVTKIGCGLAGYDEEDIAPLFKECIQLENVYLPIEFIDFINKNLIYI